MDDQFLLLFLRNKKHNVERAFKTLRNYYFFKKKYSRVFTDFLPSEHEKVISMNCYSPMPFTDSHGRTIVVCQPGRYKWEESSVDAFMAFAVDLGILLNKTEAFSICGAVLIFDLKDFSMETLLKFVSLKFLIFAFRCLQDCLPYSMKGIHVVNEPSFFQTCYGAIKLALPEKIRKRVFFHGSNLQGLHKYVTPEVLPEELGGNLGPVDNTEFLKFALNQESLFKDMIKCGFKKTTSPKSE
ncbi:Alpha-tocopherol transfer protein-like protein, partial [Stegodyphus mimosarum]